jgi:hypothetical protein
MTQSLRGEEIEELSIHDQTGGGLSIQISEVAFG